MTNDGSGARCDIAVVVDQLDHPALLEVVAEQVPTGTCHLESLRAVVVAQRQERVRRGLAPRLAQAVLYRRGVADATHSDAWHSVGVSVGCLQRKRRNATESLPP